MKLPQLIREQVDLTLMNSFHVKAKARYFAEIRSTDDIKVIKTTGLIDHNQGRLILGGGSNILFLDDFPGLVLHPVMKGIKTELISNSDQILLTVASGENWHELVTYCVEQNLGGIENLALIPGNCGAAPIQNIGAYGTELSDILEWVDAIDLETGKLQRFNAPDCQFGYRKSIFKTDFGKKFFISSITLRLTVKNHVIKESYSALREELKGLTKNQLNIRRIFDAVVSVRRKKLPDPQVTGNAGSFFKNPVIDQNHFIYLQQNHPTIPFYNTDNQQFKIPAAWLIEQAGWKGKQFGSVGVHPLQALVIINNGTANGREILEFSEQIQEDVESKFGIRLEREVNVI